MDGSTEPQQRLIRKGCEQLGYSWHVIRAMCVAAGTSAIAYGLPDQPKQSMMVTTFGDPGKGANCFTWPARKAADNGDK